MFANRRDHEIYFVDDQFRLRELHIVTALFGDDQFTVRGQFGQPFLRRPPPLFELRGPQAGRSFVYWLSATDDYQRQIAQSPRTARPFHFRPDASIDRDSSEVSATQAGGENAAASRGSLLMRKRVIPNSDSDSLTLSEASWVLMAS